MQDPAPFRVLQEFLSFYEGDVRGFSEGEPNDERKRRIEQFLARDMSQEEEDAFLKELLESPEMLEWLAEKLKHP